MSQTPEPQNPYNSPGDSSSEPPFASDRTPSPHDAGDGTGGVIPYKNMPALIAYYLAVFSLIPCLGILLGIPAVILGFIGLQRHKANPLVRGTAHAWIGIILGGCMSLLWLGLVITFALAGVYSRNMP